MRLRRCFLIIALLAAPSAALSQTTVSLLYNFCSQIGNQNYCDDGSDPTNASSSQATAIFMEPPEAAEPHLKTRPVQRRLAAEQYSGSAPRES